MLNDRNTIAAISTAQGQGGIGIVRLSGNDALKIAKKICSGTIFVGNVTRLSGNSLI